ncbi:MAG: leucyl aminopeptidase family protein [Roseinatronobacter sp.]
MFLTSNHNPAGFASEHDPAVDLHLVDAEDLISWTEKQPEAVRAWLAATGFKAKAGDVALCPDAHGRLALAVIGRGTARDRARQRFCLGGARGRLPAGAFRLHHALTQPSLEEEALGWLLAAYRFRQFRNHDSAELAELIIPHGIDAERLVAIAEGEFLTRDLINMPASHMGPEELEAAFTSLAQRHGAEMNAIRGEALLEQNLPLIHTVGRASSRAPRLLDLRWGKHGPKLTLVGKGVCFDTGGLNLKPGASMGLMKKDMGGAATVMGLAHMIMSQGWSVQLRVLVPAVENAVSGNAMRPGDILTARNGLTIEINNTDAEGRLVLADALSLADEDHPDALICMATLTGAARVALGPDIAPFFTDDADLAARLIQSGTNARDPLWQMPFHMAYEEMIEPGIADLDNAPAGGMAGAVTAALFLRRFVAETRRFVHFDIYGYQPKPASARPKGGVGQGARALFGALPAVLDL